MSKPLRNRITWEAWEADEYIITFDGHPLGQTLHKREAQQIVNWLRTGIDELNRLLTRKNDQKGEG